MIETKKSIRYLQGRIEAQGTPQKLSKSGLDFAELVGTNETAENDELSERRMSRQMSKQISVISLRSMTLGAFGSTESLNTEELIDENTEGVGMEESSAGKVKGSVAMKYFKAGGSCFMVFLVIFSLGLEQVLASFVDYWVSVW